MFSLTLEMLTFYLYLPISKIIAYWVAILIHTTYRFQVTGTTTSTYYNCHSAEQPQGIRYIYVKRLLFFDPNFSVKIQSFFVESRKLLRTTVSRLSQLSLHFEFDYFLCPSFCRRHIF